MDRQRAFWWHDSARLLVQYLAVGVAFIPSGLVYGFLVLYGRDNWLLAALLVAAGLVPAYFLWTALERRFARQREATTMHREARTEPGLIDVVNIYAPPPPQRITRPNTGSQPASSPTYTIALREFPGPDVSGAQLIAREQV
jgi:hypothetical protein